MPSDVCVTCTGINNVVLLTDRTRAARLAAWRRTGMPLIRASLLVTHAPAKTKTTSPAANQQLYAALKVSSER